MQKFEEQQFNIGELKGISSKNIEEHLKLYAGYVKSANLISEKLGELWMAGPDKNQYLMSELARRFSFEYNGMRNHEIYFSLLSGGAKPLPEDSELLKKILADYGGDKEIIFTIFKAMALTRGVGWAMLWYDKKEDRLMNSWVDEQHLGQLQGCTPIIALDMWEHAYVYDYPTSEKKKYIDAFFENLNWAQIEENYLNAISA